MGPSRNDNIVINLNKDNLDGTNWSDYMESNLYAWSFHYRLKNSHLIGVYSESLTVDNWAIHLWNTIFIPLLTKQTLFVISVEFEMQYEHKLWVKINIDMNVEPSISKEGESIFKLIRIGFLLFYKLLLFNLNGKI